MFDPYSFPLNSFLHIKNLAKSYKRASKTIKVKNYNSGEKVKESGSYLRRQVAERDNIHLRRDISNGLFPLLRQ